MIDRGYTLSEAYELWRQRTLAGDHDPLDRPAYDDAAEAPADEHAQPDLR